MKKYLVLVCVVALMVGCSSAGGLNIISPSTPEDEVKEKMSKAPVTKLEVVSEAELKEQRQTPPAKAPVETPPKTATATAQARPVDASAPSIRSGHALEALINLLEKNGTIKREELLREIRKLEEKEYTK